MINRRNFFNSLILGVGGVLSLGFLNKSNKIIPKSKLYFEKLVFDDIKKGILDYNFHTEKGSILLRKISDSLSYFGGFRIKNNWKYDYDIKLDKIVLEFEYI